MNSFRRAALAAVAAPLLLAAEAPAHPIFKGCPPDSVRVGDVCIDTYEASVWQIPDPMGVNAFLVKKLRKGQATLADLTSAGATQLGCDFAPFNLTDYPVSFPDNGNWTAPVYAASVPGVLPSSCITWFQAEQACRLAGRRLPTNQEWQAAAAGTPDPGDPDDNATECETGVDSGVDPINTGSRSSCKSSWGAFDMVGNVKEYVADWGDRPSGCQLWDAAFGSDRTCFGGAGLDHFPGRLSRGGAWHDGTAAGVFDADGGLDPADEENATGFRCAR